MLNLRFDTGLVTHGPCNSVQQGLVVYGFAEKGHRSQFARPIARFIIILGGLGRIPGALLGGLILGLIDSIVATALGAEPAFLLSFVFIILLLLFKPTGLFGHEV